MKRSLLLLLTLAGDYPTHAQVRTDTTYAQAWRPQVHFSAKKNWLNDPNGLVFFKGEYHLFYQHNPQGIRWGHMSWGHAVSRDMLNWQELPIAITEEPAKDNPKDTIMAFSGSCVIDKNNTAGFGKNAMVAIYTGHRKGNQSQFLAYSLDRGRTFNRYEGNPVLDRKQADFRDPNVFWHEGVKRWIMTVVLPHEQRALIYHSKNLKDWTEVSSFQVKNSALGIWECPALLPVPVTGSPTVSKWVLLQSVGSGAVAGGSCMQYFVGDFDGTRFKSQDTTTRWVDYGRDYYAAIPVGNLAKAITIGWMNNWQYAQDVPTTPFRSAMTLPRELSLIKTVSGYVLSQQPVAQFNQLYADKGVTQLRHEDPKAIISGYVTGLQNAPFEVSIDVNQGEFRVGLQYGTAEKTVIGYDPARNELYVDRSQSGVLVNKTTYPPRTAAPISWNGPADAPKMQTLRIIVDRSSVEVFTADGRTVLTNQIFPTGTLRGISVDGQVDRMQVRRLMSVWR